MTKKDITDAYSILRTIDGIIEAIPYEVLDYMKDAAIEKLGKSDIEVKGVATVKKGTGWIYEGATLDIISYREPDAIEAEMGTGRQFKLSLVGTKWHETHKYTYTYIYEQDLIIQISQE